MQSSLARQIEQLRAAIRLLIYLFIYFFGKMRVSLMLVHGELKTIARISESFGLLINGGFIAMEFILRIFCPSWCVTEICAK